MQFPSAEAPTARRSNGGSTTWMSSVPKARRPRTLRISSSRTWCGSRATAPGARPSGLASLT
jgi:hypothetical protein